MQDIFRELNKAYKEDDFDTIFNHPYGIYFLKLRSLSRTELLREFIQRENIEAENITARQLFEHIFCKEVSVERIDSFINEIYNRERQERKLNEDNIYSQLFRLSAFHWGGFYQNAVEQTIVNNYVKKIFDYNELLNSVDNDLTPRLKNYILCSWYNHWSSILIEDIFKDHTDILPAIGLVKKVDFFWHNFPFDLKVTYFPDGFMKLKRKEKGLRPELTELKAFARINNISYDRNASDDEVFNELLLKITEHPSESSKEFIAKFHLIRKEIISETIQNPKALLTWFYENQGVRRFDAANRFFIVLVDKNNLEDSWKLKRNKEILQQNIISFLDNNQDIDFNETKIQFKWNEKDYNSHAVCLFIIKE